MKNADVVIVSFRSRAVLREAVELLVSEADLRVIVVDNASDDESLDQVADLPAALVRLDRNGGFAAACNEGWRRGSAPYVLFLNPDARIDATSASRLIETLRADPSAGAAAPLIRSATGELEHSLRRFPRLTSTLSQALFLHRLLPRAAWADEVVRSPHAYADRHSVEWASGACLLVRRNLLERIGGWDERFFLYCEDTDLCKQIHDLGFSVLFEPEAIAVHAGGASAPRAALLPVLEWSRVLYARKHSSTLLAAAERGAILLGALTHALLTSRRDGARRGFLRAALRVLRGR